MNPLFPYFTMEDQGTHFKFIPTKAFQRLCKIINPKAKKYKDFVFDKKTDTVKISMNQEETKSLTPLWKFKTNKWIIVAESNYRGDFFDHRELVEVCRECGQRIDCECHDSN